MPGQLADIQATGAWQKPLGVEVKYFSTTAKGAASYARQSAQAFGDGPFTIIQSEIPTSAIIREMQVMVDRGIQTLTVLPNCSQDETGLVGGAGLDRVEA